MLNTTCIPCQFGHHEGCQGGQAPPEGMLGGWQCICKHEAAPKEVDRVAVLEREEWRVVNCVGIPVCATRASREEAEAYMNWARNAEMQLQRRVVRVEETPWQDVDPKAR